MNVFLQKRIVSIFYITETKDELCKKDHNYIYKPAIIKQFVL